MERQAGRENVRGIHPFRVREVAVGGEGGRGVVGGRGGGGNYPGSRAQWKQFYFHC